jgi:cytochrome c-type biogenesis protein CcmH
VPAVQQQLIRLGVTGPVAGQDGAPQMEAEDIVRMVSGLAARLEAQGGTADEWTRLMRSYMVLGQRDKAVAAARRARQALAQDDAALRAIDTMAQELKLTDATP